MPVVFDRRVSNSLVSHLSGAINGASIARGTSFLKDKMGQRLFPAGITIIDDPRRVRGGRSWTFDGEGVPTQRRAIVQDGVLQTWLLDSRTARQLGLTSTGHASRGTSQPPSPSATNLYMEAGTVEASDLIGGIKEGLYITEMIGNSLNGLTGDYSRGAAGFHDPRRRAGRAGGRNHRGRQFAGDVPASDTGERSGIPPRHRRADDFGGGADGRGGVVPTRRSFERAVGHEG